MATSPIGPLVWEPPYAAGVPKEIAKRQKKKKRITEILENRNPRKSEIFGKNFPLEEATKSLEPLFIDFSWPRETKVGMRVHQKD